MKFLFYSITFLILFASCRKIDVQATVNQTKQLMIQEKFAEAEQTLLPCLEAAKTNPGIFVLMALATSKQNKAEQTDSYAKQALEVQGDKPNAEILTHLGQAYLNAKIYDKALELLERSNSIAPDDEYTVSLLITAEMKNFSSLRTYSIKNKYLKLAEKHPSIRDSVNYMVTKAVTNALGPRLNRSYIAQTLSQAYQKEKNNPAVLINLGFIYDQVYRIPKRAITYYENYLESVKMLPPEHTQAEKVKRRLILLKNAL